MSIPMKNSPTMKILSFLFMILLWGSVFCPSLRATAGSAAAPALENSVAKYYHYHFYSVRYRVGMTYPDRGPYAFDLSVNGNYSVEINSVESEQRQGGVMLVFNFTDNQAYNSLLNSVLAECREDAELMLAFPGRYKFMQIGVYSDPKNSEVNTPLETNIQSCSLFTSN